MSGADHVSSGLGVDDVTPLLPGLTLRDYFAAKAMPEVMADWRSTRGTVQTTGFDEDIPTMARECYAMADAMLKARNA